MLHVGLVVTHISQEDYLLDTTILLEKEFIYGNVNNVSIYGLIQPSKRRVYSKEGNPYI